MYINERQVACMCVNDLVIARVVMVYNFNNLTYCSLREKPEVYLEGDLKVREAWESNKSRYLKSNSLFH